MVAKKVESTGSRLRKDEPTREDLLRRDKYAKALAKMAVEAETPLVIGIHGKWGAGKTSLMQMIQRCLDDDYKGKIKTVWFNPWMYQFEDAPIIPLLHTIKSAFKVTGKAKKEGTKLFSIIGNLVGELVLAASTGGRISINDIMSQGLAFEEKYFETKLITQRLHESFDESITELLNEHKLNRLVIFIDDLDRCQPDLALKVLEAIKLFLNAENCLYFVGIDREIVETAIKMRYKNERIEGRDYLQKIIQMPFTIPEIDETNIEGFIKDITRDMGKDFEDLIGLLIQGVGRNPRQVNRFINTFRLNDILAQDIENYEKEILLKLLIIQFNYPELYEEIAEDNQIYFKLERYFNGEQLKDDELFDSFPRYQNDKRLREVFVGGKIKEIRNIKDYIHLTKITIEEKKEEEKPALDEILERDRREKSRAASVRERLDIPIKIPGGKFLMGFSEEEAEQLAKQYGLSDGWIKGVTPEREEDVQEFLIDKYPVTNAQYKEFIDETGHQPPENWREGTYHPLSKRDHPVVYVSWHDAVAYSKWRSKKYKSSFRLPTEEEWEKAARGVDGRRYPWGNEFDENRCNMRESGIGDTTPVDKYPDGASPYGVMDMAGNVWEWTDSWYDAEKDTKVLRGGSWGVGQVGARCSDRLRENPVLRLNYIGFRCARDLK